jgi:hypothetical protein
MWTKLSEYVLLLSIIVCTNPIIMKIKLKAKRFIKDEKLTRKTFIPWSCGTHSAARYNLLDTMPDLPYQLTDSF